MKIIKIENGVLKQFCYVVQDKDAVLIIDPGLDTKGIIDVLEKHKLKPTSVLLTHGHFDHIYSASKLKDMGAKICISEIDAPKLLDNELNMGFLFGVDCVKVLPDKFFVEGENEIDGIKMNVVFTPGHTSGSVVIFIDNNAFTGDTYFEEGVYGRTDLLDGNQQLIEESIRKIEPLLKGKKIFPGH